MKTQKNHETLTLSIGSILLTLGVCYWFYLSPVIRNFSQLQQDVQKLANNLANQPKELEHFQNQTLQTVQNIEIAQKEMGIAEEHTKQFLKLFQTLDPMETVVEVSKLFKKNNILLMESSFVDSVQVSSETPKLSDLLKKPDIITRYEHQSNPDRTKAIHYFLKLEFIANFIDVSILMEELSRLKIRVFPLGLKMDKTEGEKNYHRWQLILWL